MKVSDPIKRAVPFCLCLCILCCLLPAIAAISGSTASIKLCILSDLHYLAAADQAAADGNEWRLYGESAPATEEAIEAVIRQRPDVLLLTGDLTSGAGRASAEELAQKLQKVEQAGIRVFVINGESDMSGGYPPPNSGISSMRTATTARTAPPTISPSLQKRRYKAAFPMRLRQSPASACS